MHAPGTRQRRVWCGWAGKDGCGAVQKTTTLTIGTTSRFSNLISGGGFSRHFGLFLRYLHWRLFHFLWPAQLQAPHTHTHKGWTTVRPKRIKTQEVFEDRKSLTAAEAAHQASYTEKGVVRRRSQCSVGAWQDSCDRMLEPAGRRTLRSVLVMMARISQSAP